MKRLRRLLSRRRARDAEQAFVLEGTTIVDEALDAGIELEAVFVTAGAAESTLDRAAAAGVAVRELAPGVIERVADTVTPQPVLAVARYLDAPLEIVQDVTLAVVCVGVSDPGNAGTLLRSAEAAGVGAVVCCDGSVDVYNPKTVRASAGALFHVPVVAGGDAVEVLDRIGGWGLRRLGAAPSGGDDYTHVDLAGPTAFVVGNEAHGLPPALGRSLDGHVTIPMAGRAESLNVGTATAILCFEAARQRREPRP